MKWFKDKLKRLLTPDLLILTIFLLISLIPIYWYRTDSIIHGLDIGLPINYSSYLKKGLSLWDSSIDSGKKEVLRATRLFEFLLFKGISFLGFSSSLNEIFYFCLIIFLILFSFYVFILTFMGDRKSRLVGFFGAIFYLFNFYSLTRWEGVDRPVFYVMISVPLILTALIKNSSSESLNNYLLLAFSSLILGTAATNPPTFLAGVFCVLIFLVWLLARNILSFGLESRKRQLLSLFKSAIVVLTANLFWIVPSLSLGSPRAMFVLADPVDWLDPISQSTSFSNVFRLMGAWYWYDKYQGNPYAPYSMIYFQNSFYIFLTYLIPLLCLLGMIVSLIRKKGLFFFAVFIAGFIFSMGTHYPFKDFYRFFYNQLILFRIFRSPWFKFTILTILGYSFFYGVISDYLLKRPVLRKSRIINTSILLVFFLLPIILNQPLFLGHIYDNYRVRVPLYVREGIKFLESNVKEGQRLLLLPIAKSENYSWNYRSGTSAFYYLTNLGTFGPWSVSSQQHYYGEYLKQINKVFSRNDIKEENVSSLLAALGIKYLVHRKDIVFAPDENRESHSDVQRLIGNQDNISFLKSVGEWDIYENLQVRPLFTFHPFLVKVDNLDELFKGVKENSSASYYLGSPDEPEILQKLRLSPKDFTEKDGQLNYNWVARPGISYRLILKSDLNKKIYLNNKKIEPEEISRDGVSFLANPDKNNNLISIEAAEDEEENLLKNGDFSRETLDWEVKPEGTFFGKPRQIFRVIGPGKASLRAINQSLVFRQQVDGLTAGGHYRLRFSFQSLSGLPLLLEIKSSEIAPKIILNSEENVFFSEDFATRELFFSPSDSGSIILSIYLKVTSAQENSQILGNLLISEVREFDYWEILPEVKENFKEIQYEKTGNPGYRLAFETESPGWLFFNSSFDHSWVARENGKILKHVLINNFSNGFYLNKAGSHSIEIFFLPQKMFEKMTKLSFAFIGLLLTVSFLKFLFKRHFLH